MLHDSRSEYKKTKELSWSCWVLQLMIPELLVMQNMLVSVLAKWFRPVQSPKLGMVSSNESNYFSLINLRFKLISFIDLSLDLVKDVFVSRSRARIVSCNSLVIYLHLFYFMYIFFPYCSSVLLKANKRKNLRKQEKYESSSLPIFKQLFQLFTRVDADKYKFCSCIVGEFQLWRSN